MRNIILVICAFVFGLVHPSFAQEAAGLQQETPKTEEITATAYCNDCKWHGAESELKDEKCPKCGSSNLTITRQVNLEEQQRLKDQQQTMEQLNRQREVNDVQRSIDNIRKINEFNQQQRNVEQINKINEQNRKR